LVFKDSLYVCGGLAKNIFTLNFSKKANLIDHLILNLKDTMEWKKIQQQENYFEKTGWHENLFSGDIYKEHLVVLSRKKYFDSQKRSWAESNQLRCWNMSIQCFFCLFLTTIDTNSWRIFNIKETGLDKFYGNPIVYRNSLLIAGESEGKICLVTYNLDSKTDFLVSLSLIPHRSWVGRSNIS